MPSRPRGCGIGTRLRCLSLVVATFVATSINTTPAVANDATAAAAASEPAVVDWTALAGLPGTDGTVLATAYTPTDGSLYIAGSFGIAGTRQAANIARWDGNAWTPLGTGLNGVVRALATGADGRLYAGGDFTRAGGETASRVAVWDGSAWSALDGGANGAVRALAVGADGSLYAGGDFTFAGGASAPHIARWDGSSWAPLGEGLNAIVHALALDAEGRLVAAGQFTSAGTTTASRIARWDGSKWSALGSGLNGIGRALCLAPDGVLVAGGDFTQAGGVAAAHIAQFSGATWSPVGAGLDGSVYGLARDTDGRLYAGGPFTTVSGIATWDGTSWTIPGTGTNGIVRTLAITPQGIVAGGTFTQAAGMGALHVARWQSGTWSRMGSGFDSWVHAIVTDGADGWYVAGNFTVAGDATAARVAHWDGTAWHALGAGLNGAAYALARDSAGNVYVGGAFTEAGGAAARRIARWDGSAWSSLSSGMDNTVYSLAVDSTGRLYAGGDFVTAGTTSANRIACWTSGAWIALRDGCNSRVCALATDADGSLYAGGAFTTAGSTPAAYIARWDGQSWTSTGGGMSSQVLCLHVSGDGTLYAGGDFTRAGSVSTNHLAAWADGRWSALGNGTNGLVWSLAEEADGTLYAGGEFTTADGAPALHAARWSQGAWQAMGSGTNGTAWSLVAAPGGGVLVGGDFTTAGSVVAGGIAIATIPPLHLSAPAGGEQWLAGTTHTLSWRTNGPAFVDLDYSADGGATWHSIATGVEASFGQWEWRVPSIATGAAFVRVRAAGVDAPASTNAAPFAILLPALTLTSPVNDTTWITSDGHDVTWTSAHIQYLGIDFSSDGGATWTRVASGVDATLGRHLLPTPDVPTTQGRLRLVAEELPGIVAQSPATITVKRLSFDTSLDGRHLEAGSTIQLSWTSSIATLRLEYSTDGGETWNIVADALDATTGSTTWTVPDMPAAEVLLRLSDVEHPEFAVQSATFAVASLHLDAPDDGAVLAAGSTHTIAWTSDGVDNVDLSYSLDLGSTWSDIATGLPAAPGTYSWNLPAKASDAVIVRVRDHDDRTLRVYNKMPITIASLGWISPAGERLTASASTTLTYSASFAGTLQLDFSRDGGATWRAVATLRADAAGTYDWTVPFPATTRALLRLTSLDVPGLTTTTESFQIGVPTRFVRLVPILTTIVNPSNVAVFFQATDEGDVGIAGLDLSEFELREDDELLSPVESPAHLTTFDSSSAQLRTVLLLDNSISIGAAAWADVRQAARDFVTARRPGQLISIYTFSDSLVRLCDFTDDDTTLQAAVDSASLDATASSNLYGALAATLARWSDTLQPERIEVGSVVVLTDGPDTQASISLSDLVDARGDKRVTTIAIGEAVGLPALSELANFGHYDVTATSQLPAVLRGVQQAIGSLVASYYWLDYSSPKRNGEDHTFTAAILSNDNTGADAKLEASFNSGTFNSVVPGIVANPSPLDPGGVDYLLIRSYESVRVHFETPFKVGAGQYTIEASAPGVIDITPEFDAGTFTLRALTDLSPPVFYLTIYDIVHGDRLTLPVDIAPPDPLTLHSPAGGETLVAGTPTTISWASTLGGTLRIDYSTDAGLHWNTISREVPAADGFFAWTPPYEPTGLGLVRLVAEDAADPVVASSTAFTIDTRERYIGFHLLSQSQGPNSYLNVVFTAHNEYQYPITDLDLAELKITDDGQPLAEGESQVRLTYLPAVHTVWRLRTTVLMDISSSVTPTELAQLKAALRSFVTTKDADHEIALYTFSDQITLLQDTTADADLLLAAIDSVHAAVTPSTDLYGALLEAFEEPAISQEGNVVVLHSTVVLSDGRDTAGLHTLDDVLTARNGDPDTSASLQYVVSVALGDDVDVDVLTSISNLGYFIVTDSTLLGATFHQVATYLANRPEGSYLLSYVSPRRASGDHDLGIALTHNTNLADDNTMTVTYQSDGFTSVEAAVVVNATAALPDGVDTLTLPANGSTIVTIETRFASSAPVYEFTTSAPDTVSIVPGPTRHSYVINTSTFSGDSATLDIEDIDRGLTRTVHLNFPSVDAFEAYTGSLRLAGTSATSTAVPYPDGLPNLVRFAMDLPANPTPGQLPSLRIETVDGVPSLCYEYRKRSDLGGVTFDPQWSTDLTTWHDVDADKIVDLPDDGDGTGRRVVVWPLDGSHSVMLRLQATRP